MERNLEYVNNTDENKIRSSFKNDVEQSVTDKIKRNYEMSSKVGWEESLRAALQWVTHELTDVLKKVQTPIVCINSDRRQMEIETARKYSTSFNVKIVNGVGHSVMLEAPDEFNRLLAENVKEFQIAHNKAKQPAINFSQTLLMLDFQ